MTIRSARSVTAYFWRWRVPWAAMLCWYLAVWLVSR
jgi:hypothetical protein